MNNDNDVQKIIDKIDLSEFSGEGSKLSLQEVFKLASKLAIEKLVNFKDKLVTGDFSGMFTLLKKGDPVAISILISSLISGGIVFYMLWSFKSPDDNQNDVKSKESIEQIALRDFTTDQLREYDGINRKEIYIAIKGDVYDVSKSSDLYGENGAYHCFSGRDSTRALAKLSFEEDDLSNPRYDDLGPFERDSLENWVQKFKYYRCYPVVGRVSNPPVEYAGRKFKREDLAVYNGTQAVPDGRIDAPIYIGLNGKVLDVSYGGKEHYGSEGGYQLFAGKDVSRALAKMSFKDEDVNGFDLSDLNEAETRTLMDWEKKFIEVKKYPVVGRIES